jgi:hypothetical protein
MPYQPTLHKKQLTAQATGIGPAPLLQERAGEAVVNFFFLFCIFNNILSNEFDENFFSNLSSRISTSGATCEKITSCALA